MKWPGGRSECGQERHGSLYRRVDGCPPAGHGGLEKQVRWLWNEVGYTLIGHSERRSKYGETDEELDS